MQVTFDFFRRFRGTKTLPTPRSEEDSKDCEYRGVKIKTAFPHIQANLQIITNAPKFQKWVDSFNTDEIDFREFHVTDVDFFGPPAPHRLGFVKGTGVAFNKLTGDPIPAIAFVRGAAVAVLIIVRITGTNKKYVLMCKQLRFPSGGALVEACAGMIDECTKEVIGVVFKEVKEETGFTIIENELVSLGSIRPSGGGCDEIIHLYSWETDILEHEFEDKKLEEFGEEGSTEKIRLIFYEFNEFDDVVDTIGDVKAECCWRRYRKGKLRNEGGEMKKASGGGASTRGVADVREYSSSTLLATSSSTSMVGGTAALSGKLPALSGRSPTYGYGANGQQLQQSKTYVPSDLDKVKIPAVAVASASAHTSIHSPAHGAKSSRVSTPAEVLDDIESFRQKPHPE